MNKKISLGSAIALMAIVVAMTLVMTIVFFTNVFNSKLAGINEKEKMYTKLADLDHTVRYMYSGEIDEAALMDSLARGYVEGLGDPEAVYLTPEQYQQQNTGNANRLVGIGAEFAREDGGYILVTQVYANSPAELAGVQVGDMIVQVDAISVSAENYDNIVDGIRGEAGSKVQLTVRRDNEDTEIEVARQFVEVPTVSSQISDSVGYILISEFASNTPNQFNRTVDELKKDGVTALVIDVRGNSTGTLESMVQVLDQLVPSGPMLASTDKNGNVEILAESDNKEIDIPVVVLVDENSVCYSELFAQVLRDFGKGKIVGSVTAGKCSQQETKQLEDGSAVRLTVADYHTPSGTVLNGVGVKPDYEVKITEDQKQLAKISLDNDPQFVKAKELAISLTRISGSGS